MEFLDIFTSLILEKRVYCNHPLTTPLNANVGWKVGDRMGMILETCAEPGFLHVDATGKFSLKEAKRTFLEMLEAVARHGVKKVLFDGRKLIGEPMTIERFYYGEFAANAVMSFADRGVSPVTQFAYILEEPILDPRRFGESVAVNRGMFVKAFDNVEDAVGWLQITPAHKPGAGGS